MGAAELFKMDASVKRVRPEPKAMPWIDGRLRRWAECLPCDAGMGGSGALGASYGNSVLAGVIAGQGVVIRSTADSPSIPDDVYEVDRVMRELEAEEPDLFAVLYEHYQHADAVEEVRVARCGCARRTYFRRLAQGHGAVAFKLKRKDGRGSGVGRSSARDQLMKKFKKRG